MKKYIKPEIEVKLFETNNSIADSISGTFTNQNVVGGNNAGSASWGSIFGN